MLKYIYYSSIFTLIIFIESLSFYIDNNLSPFIEQHFYWFTFIFTSLLFLYIGSVCCLCTSLLKNEKWSLSIIKENKIWLFIIITMFIFILPSIYYGFEILSTILDQASALSIFTLAITILFLGSISIALIFGVIILFVAFVLIIELLMST